MGRQSASRLQVSGYRFLTRRIEHALVRGDVAMLDDPLRARALSLVTGCIVAVIAVAGCAMLAFLRPQDALGAQPIIMTRESGALYVRIGDTLHPVLNLASARLITGTPASPQVVNESAVDTAKRGPTVGIPGAPARIERPLSADETAWTICDDGPSTTVVVGITRHSARIGPLTAGSAVLVASRAGSAAQTYLLYDGRRARVDLRDRAVVRALRLDGVTAQPVSQALLDSVPEVPPIVPPPVPGLGSPGALREFAVGTVVRLVRSDTIEYYVVLVDGVQRIGGVTADLIRFTVPQRDTEVPAIAADTVAAVPTVSALAVDTYPDRSGAVNRPVVCVSGKFSGTPRTTVLAGDSLPLDGQAPVTLAQSDGHGPRIDTVAMPPGSSVYLQTTGITGGGAGPLFAMTESGVLFGLRDEAVAAALGLSAAPVPAPWPMLASLPRGPELSKEAASVAREGMSAP
jgi:type VII secretion protein EccB